MKNLVRLASIAGLIAFSGSAAFAQSDMKARVPFAFATPGGGQMPAGTYAVSKLSNNSVLTTYRLYNVESRKSVIAFAAEVVQRPEKDTTYAPQLTFRCAGENCAISGIFHTGSKYGSGMRVRMKNVDPAMQIAEIAIPVGE
ncbi:MAG: hypothetical protein H7039_05930 [Bryobacteraceae bacterium]|nr:hypothetical protein [Bryobacteraceae bacterium]